MSRLTKAIVLCVLVAACGSGNYSAPRNLDNACSILAQRPGYLNAMKRTERKWGVPVHVQMATIYQESKFIGNARTPLRYTLGVIPMGRQSSAYGYSQALDGTWEEYQRDQRAFRAKRDDIDDATDFMGWYMAQSRDRLGIPLTDARNQYLAYHEGRTGYARGSYNAKPWLIRVAGEVGQRSINYRSQLASCGKA
ncbi:lytic transglycosylase [Nereida sp. MMG025]|uniref:transglycosylase SLT domain-containing protein n=1 Tax=Nereida sp. MMG025 TaxID=2909981 RepID=UPI001F41CC2B|nr:lytic transglycosylase [Nereida sp. MMG025]MCF6444808.1 lytic transglycosylase [Nereida sp. MMG025]